MRIIGGEWRSRRLRSARRAGLRPTSDRLRETLFDLLGAGVAGRGFVDAFAGTGAVGLEAYSRGARPVVWIEEARAAARLLRSNLAALGAEGVQALVWERRLPAAVAQLSRLPALQAAGGAAWVFLDPPYEDVQATERLLCGLGRYPGALAKGGQVIAETRRGTPLPEQAGGWRRLRIHVQGDSQLAFFGAND
ncbi:MAG: 16S rRNA (guanine(966)-N(2))-methyltransferase RsmD [Terriglobales bacterium]